tara:strand:- start:426 stop:704 length:279 start_codon:yes stop_codon:yes gene_type:complete
VYGQNNIGSLFAVVAGDYMGEFLLCMERGNDEYVFMSLPDFKILKVPDVEVERGLNSKVIDFIEKIPKKYFKECCEQYKKIQNEKSSTNRFK